MVEIIETLLEMEGVSKVRKIIKPRLEINVTK